MTRPFLTAHWRQLLMLNYPIEPAALQPYVPAGTELDSHDGQHYVSIVGFRFEQTRLRGWRIPGHGSFDEINLRFYVRHRASAGWRRGVVFIKEIVHRWAIATVARWVYNENYVCWPTRSRLEPGALCYAWTAAEREHSIHAAFTGEPTLPQPGSVAEFITEHYWGYVRQRDGGTKEYRVSHPQWRVWPTASAQFDGDPAAVYGQPFAAVLSAPPASALVAEGSAVEVWPGARVEKRCQELFHNSFTHCVKEL